MKRIGLFSAIAIGLAAGAAMPHLEPVRAKVPKIDLSAIPQHISTYTYKRRRAKKRKGSGKHKKAW